MSKVTQIAVYFERGKRISLRGKSSSQPAQSGTLGMVSQLITGLSGMAELEITCYSPDDVSDLTLNYRWCRNLSDAAEQSRSEGRDYLLFVTAHNADQIGVLRTNWSPLKLIPWAHNWISREWCNISSKNPSVNQVVCVSEIQRSYLAHHPVYDKCLTIYNFVDTSFWKPQFPPNTPEYKFTYIGALKPSKGFHHIADCWIKVSNKFPHARLSVCGGPDIYEHTGPLGPSGIAESSYEEKILSPLGGSRKSAFDAGVTFLGSLDKYQLSDEARSSKVILVNPNHLRGESVETFCLSAVEAMSLGKVVIGGRRGGLIETVGKMGILINNKVSLENALIETLQDDFKTKFNGKNIREWVLKRFDIDDRLEDWRKLFRRELVPIKPRVRCATYALRRIFRLLSS